MDLKEIGRPLTFIVHDGQYVSLLSEKDKDDSPRELRGIVNLLVALLISTNVGSCLKSLDENGFTLNKLK